MVIVDVRGCSGSGKTHIARALMRGTMESVYQTHGTIVSGWRLAPQIPLVYILGTYGSTCGGCDTIAKQDTVCALVREYAQRGHVFFEGLIVSTIFSRYLALDKELTAQGHQYVWTFLDTPLATCFERLDHRREESGTTRKYNPALTTAKWKMIRNNAKKARAHQRLVRELSHLDDGGKIVASWFSEGKV